MIRILNSKKCILCDNILEQRYTESVNRFNKRKCCSYSCARKNNPNKPWLGKKFTQKHKDNISKNSIFHGETNPKWKGGITIENKKIRGSIEYKKWRESIFSRDNWTCTDCNKIGGRLHAHHIKPFCFFPELRLDTNNGVTLCRECHKKPGLHSWSKETITKTKT